MSAYCPMVPDVRSHDTNISSPAVSELAMGRNVSTAQAPKGIASVGLANISRLNSGAYSGDICEMLTVETFKAVK